MRLTLDDLEKDVNYFLSEGWKLQGGIAVDNSDYYQAMYKETE